MNSPLVVSNMSMKITQKRINFFKVIYVILCLAGLGWQFYEISDNYFKFYEVTTVRIDIPEEEEARILNVCFDLLDVETTTSSYIPFFQEPSIYRVSIDEKFQRTKTMKEMSQSCQSIGKNHEVIENDCNRFNMSKFLIKNFACYRFEPKFHDKFSNSRNYFSSLTISNQILYSIKFYENETSYVKRIHALMTSSDLLPWNSFIFSNPVLLTENPYRNCEVSSSVFNISRLPPPYVDRCINYNIEYGCDDSVDCFSNCVK